VANLTDALGHLKTLADCGGDTDAAEEWLNERIWEITTKLGDYPEPEPT
jgi:hypothetical protein